MTLVPGGSEHKAARSGGSRRGARGCSGLLALLSVTVLVAACGGGTSSVTEERVAAPVWVVLGSSTAAGVGASPGRSWAARLDARLAPRDLRLDNRARGGATTYAALPAGAARPAGRPPTDPVQDIDRALEIAPRALLLAFPSNDAVQDYRATESAANLLALHERASARGVPVLVLSSQPRNDAGPEARAAMREMDEAVARSVGPCFVEVHDMLSDADGRIAQAYAAGDGVHLNDVGHELVFDRIWTTVSSGACLTPP